MSKPVDPNALDTIAQAFGPDCVVVPIASILPVRAIERTAKSSHKYRQIAASIREIGLAAGRGSRYSRYQFLPFA
jgi:hypothetical protein